MRRKTILQAWIMLLLAGVLQTLPAAYASTPPYQIIFVNVGQGDATVLIDPAGFTVLIDGGPLSAGEELAAEIRALGIAEIHVMVATHPDSDHIGGLVAALRMQDVPVRSVLYNGYPGDTQTWLDFTTAVQEEGLSLVAVTYPQALTWGTIRAQVLNPNAGLLNPDSNGACLALLVETGQLKTLLACDLDSAQESEVLARPLDIDADFLKVAHHGSGSSSSQVFLEAVTPREAFISVGDNPYGHPDPEALARLQAAGARVWRTDLQGALTVLSDGVSYTVSQELPGSEAGIFLPLVFSAGSFTPPPTSVVIGAIFYDGVLGSSEADEYVEIINLGAAAQLQGWTLSDNQGHLYTFPAFEIQTQQACRVYTNENHPEACGFNYGSASAIWNNTGDCAILKNALGQEVNKKCYP